MINKNIIPLLGITAYSGMGKTTLLRKVIPLLGKKNIQVGVIKHTHHDMDIDRPNKDSYQLRQANINGLSTTLGINDGNTRKTQS